MDHREQMISFFKDVEIIQDDGSTRKMGDQEAAVFYDALQERTEATKEDDWDGMSRRLEDGTDVVIDRFGGYVPIQGYGLIGGEPFYFRARYDSATLKVGSTITVDQWEEHNVSDETQAVISYPRLVAYARVTDDEFGAGWMSPEETEAVFLLLRSGLRAVSYEEAVDALEQRKQAIDEMVKALKAEKEDVTVLTTDKEFGGPTSSVP